MMCFCISEEDEYLSRLQRDREELQRMQQQQFGDQDQGLEFQDDMFDAPGDFNGTKIFDFIPLQHVEYI